MGFINLDNLGLIMHYDTLPQGVTKWQLTIVLFAIFGGYAIAAMLDAEEADRTACMQRHYGHPVAMAQCDKLSKELKNAAP